MVRLTPGDRLPFCVGVGTDRQFYSSDIQAGRPAILVLGGSGPFQEYDPVIARLAERQFEVAALAADLLVLLGFDALGRILAKGAAPGLRVILCGETFQAECRVQLDLPALVVIDRSSRIVWSAAASTADPELIVAEAVNALGGLHQEAAAIVTPPVPVLTVPGLLDSSLCQELLARFETADTYDSGVSGCDVHGLAQNRVDHERKCRRDWLLQPGDGVQERVIELLFRRCVPEIRRVFQHQIAHVDRILVVRYDENAGHFSRHRDNTSPALAFRQFALSINLGAGAFEGGRLVFPEYSDHEFCPATGEGIVFSSGLLHEVTRVRAGRRYALLTFLHDAAAEAARLERIATYTNRTAA